MFRVTPLPLPPAPGTRPSLECARCGAGRVVLAGSPVPGQVHSHSEARGSVCRTLPLWFVNSAAR